MLGLHILLGDELFDLVDADGLVNGSAGAGVLAVLAADGAADCRERVVLFDELQRVLIFAVAGHLDVALDGDVRGAGHLAGGGAGGPGLDAAVVVSVIFVPVALAPFGVVWQLVMGILDGSLFRAELLTQTHGAGGAGLNALAAGHALGRVALGDVGGAGEVGSIEKLAGAQSVAHAHGAVADAEDLVFAVDVGYLMDIAAILGLLENLHGLLICNVVAVVGLAAVIRKVAHADAPLGLHIAGALAADALLLAAGANGHADMALVLLQPVGQMLDVHGLALGGNGLLHGDDVHADSGSSGRHHLGDSGQRQKCHALEKVSGLGEHVGMLGLDHHDLCAAGNEHVQYPALLMVGVFAVQVFPVVLHQAAFADGLHDLQQAVPVKGGVFLGQLLNGLGNALFHGDGHVQNIVRHLLVVLYGGELQRGVDAPVLRGIRGELVLADHHGRPVGNFLAELENLFVACHCLYPLF